MLFPLSLFSHCFYPLSPPPPPSLLLLSPFLHCSLLPVSLSCLLSLDNRCQFKKRPPSLLLMFSITCYLSLQCFRQRLMLPQDSFQPSENKSKNWENTGTQCYMDGVCCSEVIHKKHGWVCQLCQMQVPSPVCLCPGVYL